MLAASAASASNATPPGRTRSLPKRLPHSAAVRFRKSPRGSGQEGDVAGEGAEAADVIGEPLELEPDAAQGVRPRRDPRPLEALEHVAVRRRVSDRRVSGEGLGIVDAALVRTSDQGALDAAVLVAERYLEVEDLLAVALEPEVPRLDDAGVHGPHGYLVHLVALDAVEVHHTDHGRLVVTSVPRVVARAAGSHEADGLEPGMAARDSAPLFCDLALEEVYLRALGRHRRIRVVEDRGPDSDRRLGIVREDGHQLDAPTLGRNAEQGRHALPA